jgi:hypothetical protein
LVTPEVTEFASPKFFSHSMTVFFSNPFIALANSRVLFTASRSVSLLAPSQKINSSCSAADGFLSKDSIVLFKCK